MRPPDPAVSGEGFPRSARLTRPKEYDFVFQKGRKSVGAHFICYLAADPVPEPRLGLAVSRKVGNAVARNRVKRRIRDFFRRRRAGMAAGTHVVVVARPGSAELASGDFFGELEGLLRRGGALDG